jgi:hypothetical protein
MTISDYYKILGLPVNSTVEQIKKAYRKKAREFHPDLNHSPDAKECFIMVTEAYEFLIENHKQNEFDEEAYNQAIEDWRKYRQYRSRKKAAAHAQTTFKGFKNSKLYKSTSGPDIFTIFYSLIISVLVLAYTVIGYIERLRHPLPDLEKPSIVFFIMALIMGMAFLVISIIYLKAYLEISRKHKRK